MSRASSLAESYGKPALEGSVPQVATCPRCKTALEFSTDAIGRLRERCPKCDGRAPRPNPATPHVPQRPTTTAPALPTAIALPAVQEGELRCQLCAEGVGLNRPSARLCRNCILKRRSPTGPKVSLTPIERTCSCGATFVSKSGTMCKACREAKRTKALADHHDRVRRALELLAEREAKGAGNGR